MQWFAGMPARPQLILTLGEDRARPADMTGGTHHER
jgi:hypothetical protein